MQKYTSTWSCPTHTKCTNIIARNIKVSYSQDKLFQKIALQYYRSWGAGLTPGNSREMITVSMTINAQPTCSIDENLLFVSSINIWLKRPNSRRSPLCVSCGDEFTKGKFKVTSYLP